MREVPAAWPWAGRGACAVGWGALSEQAPQCADQWIEARRQGPPGVAPSSPGPPDASISGPDTGVTSLLVRFAVEAQGQSMGRMLRTESFLANGGNRPQWAGLEAAGSNILLLGEKTHRECSRWGAGGAWPMGVHRCGPHT